MFEGKKKNRNAKVSTLIGVDAEVRGGLAFKGGLHVDGTIKGNVIAEDDPDAMLTVGSGAHVEGDVRVSNMILNGSVSGDVYVSGTIELESDARVVGNIYYNRIEMAMGAEVNGQLIHMDEIKESEPEEKEGLAMSNKMTEREEELIENS